MRRRPVATTMLTLLMLLLATLAAPASQAGGGCHEPDGSVYTEGDASVIRMDICSFSPTISRVPVGATVRFLNTSTIDHAVVGRGSTWSSAILSPGKEYQETFAAAGTYPFSCPLHPGMVGAIVVGGAPPGGASAVIAEPPAAAADAQTSASVGGADATPVAVAALAGLGVGAVGAAVAGAAWAARRRSGTALTLD